jgi:uncharacterized protein HemX
MAEGRSLTPRIRMPKVTLPGRSSSAGRPRGKTAAETKTKEQAKPENGGKPAETKEATTKEAPKETAKPVQAESAATKPAAGSTPEPNLQERMEGLQGWMAEIERKQGRITYFGAAGLLIAILAAGAALYFGLTTKSDSATKNDFDALTTKVDALQAAATKNSKDTQNALNASVAQLQSSIAALQKQAGQNSANIATLQSQATSGAFGKGAAGAAGTAGTALTPGATTTTTPKNP